MTERRPNRQPRPLWSSDRTPSAETKAQIMRNEPTEISLSDGAVQRRTRARRSDCVAPSAKLPVESATSEVLDAAFENFTRVDVGTQENATSRDDTRTMTTELIADISAQLVLLDRQRAQLAV